MPTQPIFRSPLFNNNNNIDLRHLVANMFPLYPGSTMKTSLLYSFGRVLHERPITTVRERSMASGPDNNLTSEVMLERCVPTSLDFIDVTAR